MMSLNPSIAQPTKAEPPATPQALDRLDAYAQGVTAAGQFSGVILVAKDGKVVFERAYGLRDEKGDDPLKVDTRFDLASAGKMFTATAVLQQIASGKLALTTTLGEVLRDYPNAAMRKVTMAQLLTHSAGAGETDALFYPEDLAWRGREPKVADLVALYANRDPTFPPGTTQEYSNHTMMLLGRIVEVLSGQDYRAYVADHIFRPAGMDAGHPNDACRIDDPGQAVGYVAVAGERLPNCFAALDGGWPAGGQAFTAGDMLRFVTALRQARLGVPRALFEQATTPKLKGFGLGFFATDYGGEFLPRDLRWGHGGQLYGQCVDIRTYEATGETIVTLGNNDGPVCFRIAGFLHQDWRTRRRVTPAGAPGRR
ncbi:MAG TPA: serine hydrolase domain-containing protein [Sphingomonas sp.]|nr:serine hydrolase domain-containing protein [Sphingomonas sp.]